MESTDIDTEILHIERMTHKQSEIHENSNSLNIKRGGKRKKHSHSKNKSRNNDKLIEKKKEKSEKKEEIIEIYFEEGEEEKQENKENKQIENIKLEKILSIKDFRQIQRDSLIVNTIPAEMIICIFTFLPFSSILNLRLSCKYFKNLCHDSLFISWLGKPIFLIIFLK